MIELVESFLRRVGITAFRTHVNSLGSAGTRKRYRDALEAHFSPLRARLSDDSQRRLEKNPLRILDSKDPRDQEAAAGAPSILDLLDEADAAHHRGLLRSLEALGVEYLVDPTLVRGLDYYTRTLFEVRATSSDLGAQNALAGGGRYDAMVEGLGGPKTPAIGFSIGVERLLLSVSITGVPRGPSCYLAPLGEAGAETALKMARQLRGLGVPTEVDGRGKGIKPMLRRADALGARLCVIFGESELARGVVAVRDLAGHTQEELPIEGAARVLADRVVMSGRASAPPRSEGAR
jgi:histidyl-tRNA synthetase